MKSLLKLWALLVPLVLMGSFGGGSFGSGSSISANGKGMQGSQGSGASAPTPDFSLYDIASGPSQLAGDRHLQRHRADDGAGVLR
jgi:hypothetical protein